VCELGLTKNTKHIKQWFSTFLSWRTLSIKNNLLANPSVKLDLNYKNSTVLIQFIWYLRFGGMPKTNSTAQRLRNTVIQYVTQDMSSIDLSS